MATVNSTVDIKATPAEILGVIADLTHYPEWSGVHKHAEVLERDAGGRPSRAKMAVAAVGLTDEQTLDYVWSDHGVTWSLVKSGQQKHQQGSYDISPGKGGISHVRYELSIDPVIPMPGIIVRQVMSKAVAAATTGLRRRVESS